MSRSYALPLAASRSHDLSPTWIKSPPPSPPTFTSVRIAPLLRLDEPGQRNHLGQPCQYLVTSDRAVMVRHLHSRWISSLAMAQSRCVLPRPGKPKASTFSARDIGFPPLAYPCVSYPGQHPPGLFSRPRKPARVCKAQLGEGPAPAAGRPARRRRDSDTY